MVIFWIVLGTLYATGIVSAVAFTTCKNPEVDVHNENRCCYLSHVEQPKENKKVKIHHLC